MTDAPVLTFDPATWLVRADWHLDQGEDFSAEFWRWRGKVGMLILPNASRGVYYPTVMGLFTVDQHWKFFLHECPLTIMVSAKHLATPKLTYVMRRFRWNRPGNGWADKTYYRTRIWQLADHMAERHRAYRTMIEDLPTTGERR